MDAQQRFLQNVAAGMLAGDWTTAGVRAAAFRATGQRYRWVTALAKRLLVAHPQSPAFPTLLAFLVRDTGVASALARMARSRNIDERFPRRTIFPIPGEPLPPPPSWAAHLPRWNKESDVADVLGVTLPQLLWLADHTGRNLSQREEGLRTYRQRWVPKSRGGAHLLEIPTPLLRRTQRRLLDQLLNAIPAHPAAHGFRPGRSAVTNAAEHCGRAAVVRFDPTDFFPSIPAARVVELFRTLGYPPAVVRLLAGLCTTRLPRGVWDARPNPANDCTDHPTWVRLNTRHLPQGAPTSPALANLVAFRLDRCLAGLASASEATYTRYADDLTFSGGEELRRASARFARRVALIAAEEGFAVNRGKTRVLGRATRQTVTGVVVNVRPNLSRTAFDRLNAILTNCVRYGPADQNRTNAPDFRAHLAGTVAHAAAVNPVRGQKLWALYDRIVWPTRT